MGKKTRQKTIEDPIKDLLGEEEEFPQAEEETSVPDDSGISVDSGEKTPESNQETTPVNELQERLKELEKANKALRHVLSEERKKRKDFQSKLDYVTEMVSKSQQSSMRSSEEPPKPKIQKLELDFDEEGNPILPSDKLKDLMETYLEPYKQEMQNLRQQLSLAAASVSMAERQRREADAIKGVLGDDPTYQDAFNRIQQQWQWLDNEFTARVNSGEFNPPQSTDDAINMILNSDLPTAFQRNFPEGDLIALLDANFTPNLEMKKYKIKRLVAQIQQNNPTGSKSGAGSQKGGLPDTFKKFAKNPPIGNVPSRKASSSGLNLDSIAALSSEDFAQLTDEQRDKILKFLKEQEE